MADTFHKISQIESSDSQQGGKISLVMAWLNENFNIKVNSLDGKDIIIEPSETNPVNYQFEVSESDILLQAAEESVPLNKPTLDNILRSPNYSEHYNPLEEYLKNRQNKFKGHSQIDYLISSLKIKDEKNEKRLQTIVKKWFVAFAACAMGKAPNDVALGIVSDRAGIGKTTFFNEVIPYELRKYTKILMKASNNTLPAVYWTNNILINLDELSALTGATEDQFKMLMSADKLNIQDRGSIRTKLVKRLASVCFTSNKSPEMGGFIRNNDGGLLRRMAVIEVTSIDDYRELLDINMFWSEVMTLLNGGFDYIWNRDDFDFFIDYNKKYIVTTNAVRILRLYYQVPGANDEIRYVQAFDLLMELHKLKRIPSNMTGIDEVSIGKALSQLGFKRVVRRIKGVGPRYCYTMKKE